jgi:glycosyltransferase involved in cell wall biosynthesis
MNVNTLPPVTFLLISYNQQDYIGEALVSALAQDYANLEIIVSDDTSQDDTWRIIEEKLATYTGPHRIKALRNEKNLGIGGNLDQAVRQSSGELIFIAGGDDVSLPNRVSTVVDFWLQQDRQPDLIAAHLYDMTQTGEHCGMIRIADLGEYRSLDDWCRSPPHVIGAAQAWTRRLFDRFGGLPVGIVGEDMLMAFRAIASAGARTLPIPLVNYRRGGLTSKRRSLRAAEVIRGLIRKLGSSRIELRQMLMEARELGASPDSLQMLERLLDKENFIDGMFSSGITKQLGLCLQYRTLPLDFRIRILTYAAAPWALAPFFFLKRLRHHR